MCIKPANAKGFTLIEVLVAFTILSISIGALLVAYAGGARNTAITRDYTKAVVMAESHMAETGISRLLSGPALEKGREGRFSWRKAITPLGTVRSKGWLLFKVVVTVEWGPPGHGHSFELSGMRWGKENG
jgi:general secretion pathway protein I